MQNPLWRRVLLGAATVLAAAAAPVLVAAPAQAVPGRVVVTVSTAHDSSSPKGLLATCPAGTVPLGGGGRVTTNDPGITVVQNNPTGTGWVFAAIEQGAGTAAAWSFTVWAVCAPAPAGYQVIQANGSITPPVSAVATCSAGRKLTGAGGTLDTPLGDNARVIEIVRPNATLTSVVVTATLDPSAISGPASNNMTAYAVCINAVPGQQLVTATSPMDSADKTVSATCPFPTVPHGVGAALRNGDGRVNLLTLDPHVNPAVVAARENASGQPENWGLSTFAICLR